MQVRKGKSYPVVTPFIPLKSPLWILENRLSGDTTTSYLMARFVVWFISNTQAIPDALITGDQGERQDFLYGTYNDRYFFTCLQEGIFYRFLSSFTAQGLLSISGRCSEYKTCLTNCI